MTDLGSGFVADFDPHRDQLLQADLGRLVRSVSAEFIYGITNGSFAPGLLGLPAPVGQGSLLADDLSPVDFYARPELTSV